MRSVSTEPWTFASIASSARQAIAHRPLGTPATKTAGHFDSHLCIRQRVSDRLMFDNGVSAASPFVARETQRELKRCPHQRHGENSDQGGCASEASSS
jgi:hypothetical protein